MGRVWWKMSLNIHTDVQDARDRQPVGGFISKRYGAALCGEA